MPTTPGVARYGHDTEIESGGRTAPRRTARRSRSSALRHPEVLRCPGTDGPARLGADLHAGLRRCRTRRGRNACRTADPSTGRCTRGRAVRRGLPRQHQPGVEVRAESEDLAGSQSSDDRSPVTTCPRASSTAPSTTWTGFVPAQTPRAPEPSVWWSAVASSVSKRRMR